MPPRCAIIDLTTDGSGAGTALSRYPLRGRISYVRYNGTALNNGGSADYTFIRKGDGGTVMALTNRDGPWEFSPRMGANTITGGTSAYNTGVGPVADGSAPPCDDYLQVSVAQAAASKTDRIYVYYEGS